jgi:DNA-binding CsgD family transcriptional regulator
MNQQQAQRAPTLAEGERLYRAAQLDAALAVIEALPPAPSAQLLRASTLLRLHRTTDAIATLEKIGNAGDRESERQSILGSAYARLEQWAQAWNAFDAAINGADDEIDLQRANYYSAFAHWVQRNYAAAEQLAGKVAAHPSEWGTLAQVQLAWIAIARDDLGQAQTLLHGALVRSVGDVYVRARILWPLAAIARDSTDRSLVELVRVEATALPWTANVRDAHFHVLRFLAWCDATAGDFRSTLRNLRAAAKLAPSDAWRVTVLADRAYLVRLFSTPDVGGDLIEDARELAASIDWEKTAHEERVGLLLLAHLLSDIEASAAREALDRYESLEPTSGVVALSRDSRTKALEEFVRGCVVEAEGDSTAAAAHFGESFRTYRRLGMEWRAVLALLARGWSGHLNRGYSDYITKVLEQYPNAWLQRLVSHRISAQNVVDAQKFTPQQLRVLRELCDGAKSDAEIGAALGMAPSTARDHLVAIRQKVGVKTRRELIAYAAKRKLFG